MASFDQLKENLNQHEQQQLLQFYEDLDPKEKQHLLMDIQQLNISELNGLCEQLKHNTQNGKVDMCMEPIPSDSFGSTSRSGEKEKAEWESAGLKCISEGKVAVLILGGGQGTRLGVRYPKGMYNVGIPSQKSLYQVNAEKIFRLQELAFERTGKRGIITWYILTSETTKEETQNFFRKHNFFGLNEKNVVFFEQFTLPCVDFKGKIFLSQKHKVACAPDGNGGLYKAIREYHILDDMERRGIECVHVHCVDNILQKSADPVFIGFCRVRSADCGAKVVEKTEPNEAVGVVCKVNGVYQVVEYSEITKETSEKKDEHGRLVYNAGNICNHYFTVEFLKRVCEPDIHLPHHQAKKKIPYIDRDGARIEPKTPNGIKFEKFVFDVFKYSKSFVVFEVLREDEFSPLKNAEGAKSSSPLQARWSLASLHHRQILTAGGLIVDSNGEPIEPLTGVEKHEGEYPVKVEVSPLLSYDGENLDSLVRGKVFRSPVLIGEEIPKESNGTS